MKVIIVFFTDAMAVLHSSLPNLYAVQIRREEQTTFDHFVRSRF